MSDELKRRLMTHVTKDAGGCWICDLAKVGIGYAKITVDGRSVRAHRLAYELFVGPIPDGLLVLHDCDEPSCVNPDHLHLGTQRDNIRERSVRGRAPIAEGNNNTKLTRDDAAEIKAAIRSGATERSLARKYGVARNSIRNIKDGLAWAYVD